jgi:hypothetical protein
VPNQSTRAKKSLNVLSIPALMAALALMVFAADQCKTFKLEVPDPATLNLKDGEHVIAAVETDHGKFEARVIVKDKVASEPRLFIGRKLLEETPESRIPRPTRDCLESAEKAQNAAFSCGSWLGNAARPTLDWIVPATYAVKGCRIIKAWSRCAEANPGYFYCVAYAKCSNGASAWWDGIVGPY